MKMAVKPKDAATVIFLRQSPNSDAGPFEVLMVLRHPHSKFVPDSYVFPGGCLDHEDYSQDMENRCTGIDLKKARTILRDMSSPEKALGAWVAGIRETFEEVGLLLAYHSDGTLVSFDSEDVLDRFRSYRKKLQTGEISLVTILRNEGLTLAADRLYYFSHWITPELLPLRYDVRFFIAEMPLRQEAVHDGIELMRHVWLTPQKILDNYRRQKFNMVVPTLVTIEELSRYKTIREVIASTENKKIDAILTVMVEENGRIVEYMPDGRIFRDMPPSV
jgi:8-oxo-dGTP pyrophosphatase MutT (NUDIX family)